ncbi:ABC transporter permease [Mucilaginibacter gossypii]|uniref:AraC-type DNA-binding protein n=1 Tax=Mucilaginibacter gossypii TaxID=551996 RepID=A0A1G8AIH6_9SPHI|nr:ABC transporter permease [Mucilaginibacter gossypii]SDH20120.1 AraC-type DNA-binding protein [Mucilaginibacter gossypii]
MIFTHGMRIVANFLLENFTIKIGITEVAYLGAIYSSLGMAALLVVDKRSPRKNGWPLALALVLMQFSLVRIVAIKGRFPVDLPDSLLGLGPLIYFQVLKKCRPLEKLTSMHTWHFLPLLITLGIPLCYPAKATWLSAFSPVSVLLYLLAAHREIVAMYHSRTFIEGDRNRNEMEWLRRPLIVLGAVWLLLLILGTGHYVIIKNPVLSAIEHFLYLLSAMLLIWLAFRTFIRTQGNLDVPGTSAIKLNLNADLRRKGGQLKAALKLEHYYRDPELDLRSLAEKMDVHPNELSRIINAVFKKSFNELINEYRINDVMRKMQDRNYDHLTLLGIAYESGFNSKSTFNRAFREMTGQSPAEYKNELKNKRPTYNLGRTGHFAVRPSGHKTATIQAELELKRKLMLKNNLKIAWRNLKRNKIYTTINITGLSVGIAACLLIFLVIKYETSFDDYHQKRDRINRVVTISNGPGGVHAGVGTPLPITEALKLDFPQLEQVANIMQNSNSHYTVDDLQHTGVARKFREPLAYYADPEFFGVFDFKWLAGDRNTALSAPNTIVLSRQEANKFFGDWRTAMGKTVKFENARDLQVTGIFDDTPVNTDIPMKLAVSWATLTVAGGELYDSQQDWVSTFGAKNCYVVLPPGLTAERFNQDLLAFAKRHLPATPQKGESYQLQPLSDIHYNTDTTVYSGHPFSRQLINVIGLIGCFLLLIGCVNFINLATAQAVNRSKEVGVRKVMGSSRLQLVLQYMSETLIITTLAVSLAVVMAVLAVPMFNNLLDTELRRSFLNDPAIIMFLLGVIAAVTLVAGLYPAFVLSGFNPVAAMRNQVTAGRASGMSLRRVLVLAQFCIAQFLVIGTLVLLRQMDYFQNKPLGFNKDAVITVPVPADSLSRLKLNSLKNELLTQSGIKNVSLSLFGPSDKSGWATDIKYDNAAKPANFAVNLKWADREYFKLYEMQFVAGGPYPQGDVVKGYVVNEALVRQLGISDPKLVIGKYIMLWDRKDLYAPITGVVKDYHIKSLQNAIPPVLMGASLNQYAKLNVKIDLQHVDQTLSTIERLWNKTYPAGVYEYQFLDQTIANFYKKENALAVLYEIFASVAIFISCLGLYGLVSFMAVQRIKEVGIRKTLGASVINIVFLFYKEFTVLILIAFAVAAPIGYYCMEKWLQDYTYRIQIGPGVFVIAIASSVFIAWVTVGSKAIKAALTNPVKSLKSE